VAHQEHLELRVLLARLVHQELLAQVAVVGRVVQAAHQELPELLEPDMVM